VVWKVVRLSVRWVRDVKINVGIGMEFPANETDIKYVSDSSSSRTTTSTTTTNMDFDFFAIYHTAISEIISVREINTKEQVSYEYHSKDLPSLV
jgi:hypothetical protein